MNNNLLANITGRTGSSNDTGAWHTMSINTKAGYTIKINSAKSGHPSDGAVFSTSFNIKNGDTSSYYNVNFYDIESEMSSSDISATDFTANQTGDVKINGKTFQYKTDSQNHQAVLYYQIPNSSDRFVIRVEGNRTFVGDGEEIKTWAIINDSVLSSKELASIINFNITKR